MNTQSIEPMRQERMAVLRAYAMAKAAYDLDCEDREHDRTNERCRKHGELLDLYRAAVIAVINYGRKKFRKVCEKQGKPEMFSEIESALLNSHSGNYMSKYFPEHKVIALILARVEGVDA